MPKAFELTGSNIKATIDNVALSTLIFSVVAIAAVSTVAVTSAEKLIAINEQVLRTQRIVSGNHKALFAHLYQHRLKTDRLQT